MNAEGVLFGIRIADSPADTRTLDRHGHLTRLQTLALLDFLLAGRGVGNPEIVRRVRVDADVRL